MELEEFAAAVKENAEAVEERQETDSIPLVDDIRFHITSNVQTYSAIEEANQKLEALENLLASIGLECWCVQTLPVICSLHSPHCVGSECKNIWVWMLCFSFFVLLPIYLQAWFLFNLFVSGHLHFWFVFGFTLFFLFLLLEAVPKVQPKSVATPLYITLWRGDSGLLGMVRELIWELPTAWG